MKTEYIKEEINHSDSIYIGACKTCRDDVYSRGPQNYIVHYCKKKANVYCGEFCFDKFRERRNNV